MGPVGARKATVLRADRRFAVVAESKTGVVSCRSGVRWCLFLDDPNVEGAVEDDDHRAGTISGCLMSHWLTRWEVRIRGGPIG